MADRSKHITKILKTEIDIEEKKHCNIDYILEGQRSQTRDPGPISWIGEMQFYHYFSTN